MRNRAKTPALKLLEAVKALPEDTICAGRWAPPAHSVSHKAHWMGWLAEYDGAGFYGRRVPRHPRSMLYIYDHIHCGPMLLWLGEASGVMPDLVVAADANLRRLTERGIRDSNPKAGVEVRRVIPWFVVADALAGRGLLDR